MIINPGVGDQLVVSKTDSILSTPPVQASIGLLDFYFKTIFFIYYDIDDKLFSVSDKVKAVVQWNEATSEEWENGIRIVLNHFKEIKQVKK